MRRWERKFAPQRTNGYALQQMLKRKRREKIRVVVIDKSAKFNQKQWGTIENQLLKIDFREEEIYILENQVKRLSHGNTVDIGDFLIWKY